MSGGRDWVGQAHHRGVLACVKGVEGHGVKHIFGGDEVVGDTCGDGLENVLGGIVVLVENKPFGQKRFVSF